MSRLDWVIVGVVALAALAGMRRGFLASALSTVGIVVGAVIGARLAARLLAEGSQSPYTPVLALVGAAALALVFEGLASAAGGGLRARLPLRPLRTMDSVAGLALGAASGLALAWVAGAVALQLPGQRELRTGVQRSVVLQRLNSWVPPRDVLRTLRRVDPFPSIAGPAAPVSPPDPAVLRQPGVRLAAPSVVRVLGTACGLGVSGSGWVAGPGLVVTNAHVVAGQTDTEIEGRQVTTLEATAVAFDVQNDVAILRVPGLEARPLAIADPRPGDPVAILGYPENGPLDARAGRIGNTAAVVTADAYGRGPVTRRVTSVRGRVRRGNSGGPAVNAAGAVESTIFAAREGGGSGYGIPGEIVRGLLRRAGAPVSTGECAR